MQPCRTTLRAFRMGVEGLTDAAFSPAALRSARQQAGVSQAQLATAVGVSDQNRISLWERGLEQPRPGLVPRIAQALGVAAIDLYTVGPDGADLQVLRLAAGLTVSELAHRAGLAHIRYWRIETGRAPTDHEVTQLAAALGISASKLRKSLPSRRD